jgi:hypothetical protein
MPNGFDIPIPFLNQPFHIYFYGIIVTLGMAVTILQQAGLTQVSYLSGGLQAWARQVIRLRGRRLNTSAQPALISEIFKTSDVSH